MSAVSGAFVVLGAHDSKHYREALEAFDQGQTEWVAKLMEYGSVIEKHWEQFQLAYPDGMDFIWDYEISEKVGIFITSCAVASNGQLPDNTGISKNIQALLEGLGYPLEVLPKVA